MDNAADNYRKLQEIEKKRQEYLEKMRLYMEANKNKQDTPQDQVITEEKKVDVSNNNNVNNKVDGNE